MDGYVSKPIQADELFEAIAGVIPTAIAASRTAPAAPRDGGGRLRDASPSPVLDGAAALRGTNGDAHLLSELAGIFLGDCERQMSAVRDAVSHGDAKRVEDAAHALKGSVGSFAAPGAVEAAGNLEHLAHAGEMAGAKDACTLLEIEIERLKPALKSL
jgi:HPt (histidine-containing phosphotransfer) domain-containing protein